MFIIPNYFIGDFRILTPQEIIDIYMAAVKPQSKAEFLFYLSTGARYVEGKTILDNIDWFDPDNKVIHYKSNKKWDRDKIWKDRDILLSYWDVMNVHNFIMTNRSHATNPFNGTLRRNLQNWSNAIGVDPRGIGIRSLRKTRFAWLLNAFPEYEDVVAKSMDYNPTGCYVVKMNDDTILEYKNVPFTPKESKLIKSFLHGWDELIEQTH